MKKAEKEVILERYVASLSPSGKKQYPAIAKRVLAHIDFTKPSVEHYLSYLSDEGYSDGSIDFYWRVIRRLFHVAQVPWPFERHDNPVINEMNVMALALPIETIQTMIQAQKEGKLTLHNSFYLALSTTYGMRDAEMASLTPSHFDLNNQLIYVETAKHGRQRYHLIPDEIYPIMLEIVPHLPPANRFQVIRHFYAVEKASGLQHTPDTGWHSIRRSLDHYLLKAGLDAASLRTYMRWKRDRADMAMGYAQVRFAGQGGGHVSMSASDADQDRQIYESYHPFLRFWRD